MNQKTTKTKVVNQVVKIAQKRQTILLEALKSKTTTLHELAWQNEADLEYAAGLLERELQRGIRELTQTLSDLRNNRVGSLNECGILQNTNAAIDRGVIEVKEKMSKRLFYKELF